MSGDHSEVVPLLPIPNRTVKHLSADDSADCPCESRSLPDFPKEKPDSKESGFLLCVKVRCRWVLPAAAMKSMLLIGYNLQDGAC